MNAGFDWHNSEQYWLGIRLLNEGRYFEAHEALEDVWRVVAGTEREFLKGLIQVAAGLHHLDRKNLEGARGLWKRATAYMAPYPATFGGIRVDRLRLAVCHWLRVLESDSAETPVLDLLSPIVEVADESNS